MQVLNQSQVMVVNGGATVGNVFVGGVLGGISGASIGATTDMHYTCDNYGDLSTLTFCKLFSFIRGGIIGTVVGTLTGSTIAAAASTI